MQKPIEIEMAELKTGQIFADVRSLRRAVSYIKPGPEALAEVLALLDVVAQGDSAGYPTGQRGYI